MENQIWDNDSDKFGFSIGEDAGDFIFLIIQINQRLRNDSLILQGQGIGIIEISGNGSFRKIRIFCNIVKGDVFFSEPLYPCPLRGSCISA